MSPEDAPRGADPPTAGGPGPSLGPPRLVCFDVNEVLVDQTRAFAVWAGLLGVSPLTLGAALGAAIVQGQPPASAFSHVAPNMTWTDLVQEHERQYGGLRREDLYPDVATCLGQLRGAGVELAVADNQPPRRRGQILGLKLPLTHVLTSEDLGAAKPDPGFFDGLVRAVGAGGPGEVLYVGDRVDEDVLPALEQGLLVCWLRRGPWGQLQDLPEGVEPDLTLEGLGELPQLVASWEGPESAPGERGGGTAAD